MFSLKSALRWNIVGREEDWGLRNSKIYGLVKEMKPAKETEVWKESLDKSRRVKYHGSQVKNVFQEKGNRSILAHIKEVMKQFNKEIICKGVSNVKEK